MEQTTLDYIRQRDYLHGEDNLARVRQNEAQLRWGHHWDTPPLVTVAIPAYRRVALLRPALESALNQQGETDYQILIVDDDGMEENESALSPAEELVRQLNDPRIVYYRNRHNLGLMDNWNMCYWLARSEWVCTLHDDDLLTANFLQKMCAAVRAYPQMDRCSTWPTSLRARSWTRKALPGCWPRCRPERTVCAIRGPGG